MGAKGGGVVMMDIHNGEIIALASSPGFDANRERDERVKNKDASIYFNRVVQGVYEMGSTFKIFSVAQGIEKDLFTLDTQIDTKAFATKESFQQEVQSLKTENEALKDSLTKLQESHDSLVTQIANGLSTDGANVLPTSTGEKVQLRNLNNNNNGNRDYMKEAIDSYNKKNNNSNA